MRNINSRLNRIKKYIRKGRGEEAVELLSEFQEDLLTKQENWKKELADKHSIPVEERYLEILDSGNSSNKLTINPATGRVTLKFSSKASRTVKEELTEFTKEIMKKEFPRQNTFRGKFYFKNGYYHIQMCCGSKVSVSFSSEGVF